MFWFFIPSKTSFVSLHNMHSLKHLCYMLTYDIDASSTSASSTFGQLHFRSIMWLICSLAAVEATHASTWENQNIDRVKCTQCIAYVYICYILYRVSREFCAQIDRHRRKTKTHIQRFDCVYSMLLFRHVYPCECVQHIYWVKKYYSVRHTDRHVDD